MKLTEEQRIFSQLEVILDRPITWQTTSLIQPNIKSKTKGVYICYTENPRVFLYVGKGKILSRLDAHLQKFTNNLRGAAMTRKFNELHETNTAPRTTNIVVKWIECNSTERSCAEGFLIHKLQPLLNDEVGAD
jgi:hypothetical protein